MRIGSGAATLKTGDVDTVRAVVRDANGAERETAAAWSVENESVLRLDGTNRVTAVGPGVTSIRATAEGLSASLGITVVKNFEGVWTGFYRIEQCIHISGGGSSYCRFAVGGSRYIRLDLLQRGLQLSGQLSVGDNLGTVVYRGTATGQVVLAGGATLSGRTTSITDQPGTMEFTAWTSDLTPDGLLAGRFTANRNFTNAFGPQVGREECQFTNLKRE